MKKEYENLLIILKLFQNRPNHLSKFLIDSKAFNKEFLKKIKESDKITEINIKGITDDHLHFNNIKEMKKYYSSLVDDLENIKKDKSINELIEELNLKLKESLDNEDYEEACRIRDYMKINKIPKK
jgi:excinuclease UvrABC helicase subunit UvrB